MPTRTHLSLERKLPLLISVLLVLLTAGLTWAGYDEVRRSSELRGIDRLQRLVTQIEDVARLGVEQRFALIRRVAANGAVVSHLADPAGDPRSEAAAIAALGGLAASPADTPVVAEVLSVGETRRIATHPELAGAREPVASMIAALSYAPAAFGELYRQGDSAFYLIGARVTSGDRAVGYVVQRRRLRGSPAFESRIRGLVGSEHVSVYFASNGGGLWASLGGAAVTPPDLRAAKGDAPNVVRYVRSDTPFVAVFARVPNTPLQTLAELPEAALHERPATYLRRTVVVALLMLVVGTLAAWVLSRHITRPLRDLTAAAGAISAGDYAKRAAVERSDETGLLAEAFNTMAGKVERSHVDLERQVAETRSLAARLEEANRAKADFLATMSHELRTPLNAIGGYVDLLEMGVRGPVTEEQRRDLERVRHNQRHLLALIGNILDYTRLDAQRLPYDVGDVRLDRAVSEVLSAVEPLLEEKGLRHSCTGCDQPLAVRADRARLEQILLNLLSNAIRFTPSGGAVSLSVEARGESVAVVVADTGIGIPEDKLSAIFEPFVQLDSGLTRTVGGTGLGLTISRELARAMGGDLTAENGAEGGARFSLTLPAADVEAVALSGGVMEGSEST